MTYQRRLFLAVSAVILAAGSLFAQGTSGTLTGIVTQDGTPLPGVTVTVASPNLQGMRSTVTNDSGGYSFGALPPGEYTIRIELAGLQTVTRREQIGLSQNVRADVDLKLAALAEAITVTAAAPAVAETQEIQTNFQQKTIENLPVARTLVAITNLAPGVSPNGVNGLSISGAASYDNLYTVNGAVIQENLRGQPHSLFIEDAIQETTIQTGAISAEYGNFTGGVVNAITRSGGNEFSGSFRDSLTNPSWSQKSPNTFTTSAGSVTEVQTADLLDQINHVYEGTIGGRIVRDRLWFFGAGRYTELSSTRNLTNSQGTYTRTDENKRYEGKLTGSITSRHNLVASYLTNDAVGGPDCQLGCFDETSIDPNVSNPNNFRTLLYNGVITNNLLLEAKYANKKFAFQGYGGSDRDRVTGTPLRLIAPGFATVVNEPFFCGVCGDEDRDNDSLGLKATYFLGTRSLGSHNIVAGIERWHETRLANNYQTPSEFIIISRALGPKKINGQTVVSFRSGLDLLQYRPLVNLSQGSDLNTDAIYFNDRWDLNSNWQFNLGARYDANDASDSSGATVADDSRISPRVGAIYDPFGNGRLRFHTSYGVYVGRLADTVLGLGSAAGNNEIYQYRYDGPDIIDVPTEEALRQFWSWFDSIGGFQEAVLNGLSIPGGSTQIRQSLTSPNVQEYTGGVSATLGRGFVRVDYIHRDWRDFYDQAANLSTGRVTLPTGNQADLNLVINNNAGLERTYDAVELQTQYRFFSRFNAGLNYTYSRLEANLAGETAGSGPVTFGSTKVYYPEYYDWPDGRNAPVGPADLEDQPHRARLWASYDIPTRFGNFNVSGLQRYESGLSYGVFGTINVAFNSNFYGPGQAGGVVNPGYLTPPSSQTYWFEKPGENRWEAFSSTDLALNYDTNPRWLAGASIFIQGELINAFNNQEQTGGGGVNGGNRSVLTAFNDPTLQRFNPMAGDVPVEGVHWRKGPLFGLPTSSTNPASQGSFQLGRTYRVSAGVRF